MPNLHNTALLLLLYYYGFFYDPWRIDSDDATTEYRFVEASFSRRKVKLRVIDQRRECNIETFHCGAMAAAAPRNRSRRAPF